MREWTGWEFVNKMRYICGMEKKELFAIAAMGRNGEIGYKGDMPWHIPEDLRHFKETTMGHPVIMGRATWESLPKRPLPGRLNIVLTRNAGYAAEGAETAASMADALKKCDITPFVIGGGDVYKTALPLLSRIYVTRIDADFPDADTYFPDFSCMRLLDRSEMFTSKTGLSYRFETYENITDTASTGDR